MEKVIDLTTQEGVVSLMKSSKSETEWNNNCDEVKRANGGDYPRFWFGAIVLSGVLSTTKSLWAEYN